MELANTLNTFFFNTVKAVRIPEKFGDHYHPHSLSRHPTLSSILKHKGHPTIRVIERVSRRFSSFYFSTVNKNTVLKEIRKLKSNKVVQDKDIHIKILKNSAEYSAKYICLQYNKAIKSLHFPCCFKFGNIVAAFKQGSRNQKTNCKPISMLRVILKIFENFVCRQLLNYFDNIPSKFQCGFRKAYSPQDSLLLMIGKWKKIVDVNKIFEEIPTDLLKAFDCIFHDLLIGNLNAYILSLPATKLTMDYIQNGN